MTSVVNIASASEPAALLVKKSIASLKDTANRAAMKLRCARGVKEEQFEVVVAFLCGSDFLPFFLLYLEDACRPFTFERPPGRSDLPIQTETYRGD